MCRKLAMGRAGTRPTDLAEQRRAFASHALTFAAVIGGLVLPNLATSPGNV